MQTIKAYLYPNSVEVQVFDPAIFTVRNRVVYSRPIKVYQGVDNPLQIIVRNQDQKSVDLSEYYVIASIQDPINKLLIKEYYVNFTDVTTGKGTVTLDQPTIDSLEQRFYKFTIKTVRLTDSEIAPLYTDDNYGVPLDLEVLPAFYSATIPGGGGGNGGGGYIP